MKKLTRSNAEKAVQKAQSEFHKATVNLNNLKLDENERKAAQENFARAFDALKKATNYFNRHFKPEVYFNQFGKNLLE